MIGDMDQGGARAQTQHTAIAAMHQCRDEGLMRIEHLLHLRCELSAPDILSVFQQYAHDPLLRLVSVMDHTPGQRQWRDLVSFRRYAERNQRFSDAEFDAVIAPYHDVGMTAIKVASFGHAVNVTLGLPFPRTSPDHGTAMDIAGQGIASPESLIAAILLCARVAARQ